MQKSMSTNSGLLAALRATVFEQKCPSWLVTTGGTYILTKNICIV